MKYTLKPTTQFKRDLKKAQKQNKNLDLLNKVLQQLADSIPLPEKNRDHALRWMSGMPHSTRLASHL